MDPGSLQKLQSVFTIHSHIPPIFHSQGSTPHPSDPGDLITHPPERYILWGPHTTPLTPCWGYTALICRTISELWLWREVQGSSRGLIWDIPEFVWRDWRKPRRTSLRFVDCRGDIWAWDVQNTKQDQHPSDRGICCFQTWNMRTDTASCSPCPFCISPSWKECISNVINTILNYSNLNAWFTIIGLV